MGFSPYILLQKYIILLLRQYRQKFYPPTFESFWNEGLNVWIGHQQKTIPALRSEEQVPALGVPPGVRRCRQHTPPTLYLFLFPLISERSELIEVREQRAHSSSLRAVRTVKACEGYCKWCTSSKYSEVIMSFCWFAPSIRKPLIMFCQVTFLPLVESFFIMFYRLVCSFVASLLICVLHGLQRVWGRVWGTVCQGFWFAYLPTILVCWLSDAFVTRFSYLWQTKGHTLIQC